MRNTRQSGLQLDPLLGSQDRVHVAGDLWLRNELVDL